MQDGTAITANINDLNDKMWEIASHLIDQGYSKEEAIAIAERKVYGQ